MYLYQHMVGNSFTLTPMPSQFVLFAPIAKLLMAPLVMILMSIVKCYQPKVHLEEPKTHMI